MRLSQAFAAFRTEVVESLLLNLREELLPQFNAEVADIRQEHEKMSKESAALADHRKRSRIMDLKVRQQQFIDGLDADLKAAMEKRIKDYAGTIESKQIADGKGSKEVLEAKFPDGSTARVPKKLWVDYTQFHRV
jgi:very-short-patch-repair endonuclease